MNAADPRWLEILKASGWHTTALTVACVVVLVLIKQQVIPTDGSPYWVAVPIIGAVVFGCLSLAAIGKAIVPTVDPSTTIRRWWRRRAQQRSIRDYIPHMTAKEREIIAYLLHHNQKVFQTTQDGGYAAPLIAKGIVWPVGMAGQVFDANRVPFEIPDYVWAILVASRTTFPYDPSTEGAAPWIIPWMAR
jgi:hypothetical protein